MLGSAGVSWREQEREFQRPEWRRGVCVGGEGNLFPLPQFSHTPVIGISEMAYPDPSVESVVCVQHKYIGSIARHCIHFCLCMGTDV